MLILNIGKKELFNELTGEFIEVKGATIKLEHSLVSLRKWESKWGKNFIGRKTQLSKEETIDYIKCMTITQNVPDELYEQITSDDLKKIKEYMEAPMTATKINEYGLKSKVASANQFVTSEIIYYWMTALNIPFECQTWHLNQLLTLIRVCSIESNPKNKKKMNKKDILSQNWKTNLANRARFNSKG